jgi:hypothetical protein
MRGKPVNNSEFRELARQQLRTKPSTDPLLQYDVIRRHKLVLSVTDLKHVQVLTSNFSFAVAAFSPRMYEPRIA